MGERVDESGSTIRAMSFNIRYLNSHGGVNHWKNRAGLATRVIRDRNPDVIGMQEAWEGQIRDLLRGLPGYEWIAVKPHTPREEHNVIFYKADRLTLESSGEFWLSDDFNSVPASEAYHILAGGNPPLFRDAWDTANERTGPEGTIHNFTGDPEQRRIDWILYRGGFEAATIEHITVKDGDVYPSDHLPVYAELRLT